MKTFEQRFLNMLMKKGKYIKAERLYMDIIITLKESGIKNVYKYVRKAIYNMTPIMGVRVKKIKGAELIKPVFLNAQKAEKYAIKWLLKVVERKKLSNFANKIVEELKNAYNNKGAIMKEKWELYKQVRYATTFCRKTRRKPITRRMRMRLLFKRKKWLKFGKF
uniref:Ribosomal protein S7 n=1 Tax=Heterostelium pallidum TaxID=13642 RepID=Q5ILL3_HETPA|nr:ribosomal protein S7 [Heterostelium pallidum]AAU00597.1 ribosomal protein S7 [Heterostelium pallidum]